MLEEESTRGLGLIQEQYPFELEKTLTDSSLNCIRKYETFVYKEVLHSCRLSFRA